jgi:hypothetical protein
MQPTALTQDSPMRADTPRESLAWHAEHLWRDAGPQVLAFAGQLSDPQAAELWRALAALDQLYSDRRLEQERALWGAITAHLPGLAPTLRLLQSHLEGDTGTCLGHDRDDGGETLCQLTREVGYEG